MKTIKLLIFFLFVLLFYGANAQNRSINFELNSWAEIKHKARNQKKLIFLDAYTSWCGPCKWMAKNIFTNDTVADFYNSNFICAKFDMEKGEGLELAKTYEIKSYPTLLYLTSEGELVHRTCGSREAKIFVSDAENALSQENQLRACAEKFESGKTDSKFMLEYLDMLSKACLEYGKELDTYFMLQKNSDLSSEGNWNIIKNYTKNIDAREFQYLQTNKEEFMNRYGKTEVEDKIADIYKANLQTFKGDISIYNELKEKVRSLNLKNSEEILLDADVKMYARINNWGEYARAADEYISKYAYDDYNILNNIAWKFYENITDKALLEKAVSWAKRSIELKDAYFNNDTYAALLFKIGKREEALKAAEKAISKANESGEDSSYTQELLNKIKEMP